MKKISVELFFFKPKFVGDELDQSPNLEKYTAESKLCQVVGENIQKVKDKLSKEYNNLGYVHVLKVEQLECEI